MSTIFDDILQRAEKLNTDVRLGQNTELRLPTESSTNGTSSACSPSVLDIELDDIFRRSEEIWNRKQTLRPVAGMGATLRANKDISQLHSTRLTAPTTSAQQSVASLQEKTIEYEGINAAMLEGQFRDRDVETYVQRAFERARIEAERTFLNQTILERPHSAQSSAASLFSPRKKTQGITGEDKTTMFSLTQNRTKHLANLPSKPLAKEQNIFAQKIDAALSVDCTANIASAIKEAVKKLGNKEADYIWSKVFVMVPRQAFVNDRESVREMRSSNRWLNHVLEAGTHYLETEMENYMETTIEANLAKARRGGIPGTLSRVEAFLNVRRLTQPAYEDGLFGSHPKWAVLFLCLRQGDLLAASKVATELFNNAQCSTLVSIISNLPKTTNIDDDRRVKLRAEWKQSAQSCQDQHKRAVYGLFLGFDCHEVNGTIEDWLWAKLFTCKYAVDSTRALRQLQTIICAQHGEQYFVAEGGNHLLYFSVLILTGQLERAIILLFGVHEHRMHAVHIGILANQLHCLLTTEKVDDELLLSDVHEVNICRLNIARLVLLYVKEFELSNVAYALDYYFFLRHFQLETIVQNKAVRSVFDACVSRLVFLTNEQDAIVGSLGQRGERITGLIDKFSGALNIEQVIARVAFDTNVQGEPLGACRLYALANYPDDAIRLANNQLSQCLAENPGSESTNKAVETSRWLAQRYTRATTAEREENQQLATLLQLLDLHEFFGLAIQGSHSQAVEKIQSMRFLPSEPDDVQPCVAQFHLVPDEVRPLLPHVCVQLMRCLVSLHHSTVAGQPSRLFFQQWAKALLVYTATIPYRFPVSTNSLLLQLQSKII